MPGAEAFLEAILADPAADAPRLVFADWLDEHGDHVRAEFIRVQIALAGLEHHDPRRPALARRERELIEAIRNRWLREYPPRAAAVAPPAEEPNEVLSFFLRVMATFYGEKDPFSAWLRAIGTGPLADQFEEPFPLWPREICDWLSPCMSTFERGMLEWLRMDARMFLQHRETLLRDWPVRHLWLSDAGRYVAELAERPWPDGVTRLTLSQTLFQRGDLVRLLGSPNLANLRELSPGPRIEFDLDDVADLAGLHLDRLESLNLSSGRSFLGPPGATSLGPAGATSLAGWPQLSRLTRLRMESHDIGTDGVAALCAAGRLERLTHLGLAYNGVTADGARLIARSGFFGALEALELGGNHLGDEGVTHLARGPHQGRLRSLDLSSNGWTPAGVRELLRSAIPETLTELNLSCNSFGAEVAAALAETPALAGLQALDLSLSDLGARGARELAASPHLRRLRLLDLHGNGLGVAGVRALIDSPCLASVCSLNLRGNGLGDEAVRWLARWPGLARLKHLRLGDNVIGDAGAEALANSPYTAGVGTLWLSGNRHITEKGQAALAAAGLSNVALHLPRRRAF
jgi:uncharacterized protein (TIGR02996 family)